MGLLKKFLQKVHIIEGERKPVKDPKAKKKEEVAEEAPRPVKTKVITLEELRKMTKKLKLGNFQEIIKPGEELKLSFQEIFVRANIQEPKHGWTIMKIVERIETEEFQSMSEDQVKTMLLGEIKADKSTPKEVLQDAVSRDEILDDYEKFLTDRVTRTRDALLDENAAIEMKIKELMEKKADNEKRMEDEKKAYEQWKIDKTELEKKMAKAASFLTGESVVSVGSVTEAREPKKNSTREKERNPGETGELTKGHTPEKNPDQQKTKTIPTVTSSSGEEEPQLLDMKEFNF